MDQRLYEDLGRRIDDVRQSLDARPQPQIDSSRLEASLRELNEKLAGPNTEPLAAFMREINDKLDALGLKVAEPFLTAIIQRLDRLAGPEAFGSVIDTRLIGQALEALHAKLDLWEGRALDRQLVVQIAEELSHHLQTGSPQQIETQRLADGVAGIRVRLEALSAQFDNADSLASVVRDVLNRLPEAGSQPSARGAVASEDHASFVKELEELRAEQVTSDTRIQAGLAEI